MSLCYYPDEKSGRKFRVEWSVSEGVDVSRRKICRAVLLRYNVEARIGGR